jgi:hypothetical protein
MKHPLQVIVRAADGTVRFQGNALVQHLVAAYPGGAEALRLACPAADSGDWEQLEQLLGYSVSGFGDLPYVSREAVRAADAVAATIA